MASSRERPDRGNVYHEPRERLEQLKLRHPRNSALHGHVDYVDFAERVSLGVTVEGRTPPKRREPRG
jgi:hypothetical protein